MAISGTLDASLFLTQKTIAVSFYFELEFRTESTRDGAESQHWEVHSAFFEIG